MAHNFFVTRKSPALAYSTLFLPDSTWFLPDLCLQNSLQKIFFFFQSLSPGYVWLYRLVSNLFLSAISFPGLEVLIYSGVPVTKATVHPDCFGHPAPCLLHIWCVSWGAEGRAPCAGHNGCTVWTLYIWHNYGFNLVYSVPSIQFEFLTTAERPELTVALTYLPISKRKHCSWLIKCWDSFFLFTTFYVYLYWISSALPLPGSQFEMIILQLTHFPEKTELIIQLHHLTAAPLFHLVCEPIKHHSLSTGPYRTSLVTFLHCGSFNLLFLPPTSQF